VSGGSTATRREAPITVEKLLASSRATLDRLTPTEAREAQRRGAVLVDIRSDSQRSRDGLVPGAHVVARNVLEWRCDPACAYRDRALARPDVRLVLICDEGCQSSLAAATLQRFGLSRATDLVGGFQAWRAAGLPVLIEPPPAAPPSRGCTASSVPGARP
jgi:rhodanese-related sulfurtransferase